MSILAGYINNDGIVLIRNNNSYPLESEDVCLFQRVFSAEDIMSSEGERTPPRHRTEESDNSSGSSSVSLMFDFVPSPSSDDEVMEVEASRTLLENEPPSPVHHQNPVEPNVVVRNNADFTK